MAGLYHIGFHRSWWYLGFLSSVFQLTGLKPCCCLILKLEWWWKCKLRGKTQEQTTQRRPLCEEAQEKTSHNPTKRRQLWPAFRHILYLLCAQKEDGRVAGGRVWAMQLQPWQLSWLGLLSQNTVDWVTYCGQQKLVSHISGGWSVVDFSLGLRRLYILTW